MSAITSAAFPTVRSAIEVRDSELGELAPWTALVALEEEEGVELAQDSGIVEPAMHALCVDLFQSNAWSIDWPFADSETEVTARSEPGAAAQAFPRHAIPQAACRHERNRDELRFNTLREDIWMPEGGVLFVWPTLNSAALLRSVSHGVDGVVLNAKGSAL